jgi:LysM repeat protein
MTGLKPPGTDAVTIASRSGADTSALNAAMVAASKPGPGDALAKVSAPIEVFAPTAAQNRMLQQAGFNGNNPADAAFLASARAQLLSAHNDGSATLAAALNGANQANLNKLAALLTGKSDATANNVVLNEANIARLNALFKPEAGAMQPGMAMSLDAKNAAALGLANVLAGRQPALTQMTQREVYGELNKLGSQLITGQTVAIGELISRNLIRPTDLVAGAGLLAHKLEPLEIKPTTGSLNANPENALSVANAIAAARARALDVNGEITSGKSNAYAPHGDHVDGLSLLPGKGLVIEGKRPEGSADASIGPNGKPIATAGAEAMLNTKAAADAARANATKNIEGEHPAGAELTLGTRKDMAEPGDTVDPKKKPDGKGDNQGISIDGSLLTGAALRLFGDKKDEKKDETKASSKVDETRSQRRKYLVKEGDTLDSIAQKAFGESKMSVLIAAVNSEVIAQDTDPHAPLQLGLSIWLPSEIEVEDFVGNVNDQLTDAADQKLTAEEELTRRFGNGWDGSKKPTAEAAEPQADLITAAAAALAASTKRRENVERLLGPLSEKKIDYITYTVRLGDTLKSVATKHPALKDVALWELVASVNEITVPENNASAVKLARGSKLKLPTAAEIEEFRNANPSKKPIGSGPNSGPRTGGATGARSIVFPPGNPLANALTDKQDANAVDEHAVTRASAPIRDAGASLLRAGGFVKTHDDATIVTSPLEKLPRPEISKPITTDKPSVENIKNLSEDCRVVRRHQVDATGRLYQAQLEVLKAGVWTSVMMYNISDGNCWRKSINELGITEVLQLDLPTAAIHQMLESDFANNWQEYRDRTLSTANAY